MDAAESVAARLIGSLFVERGLASETQIALALEIQDETGQQLGEILVERFGVSRGEIATVIAEQWQDIGRSSGPGLEASLSESWRRLGESLVTRGFVTQDELERALSRQRQTGERLGEALVALGSISKFELAGALAEQMSSLDDATPDGGSPPHSGTVVALPTRATDPEDVGDAPEPEDEHAAGATEGPNAGYRRLEALPTLEAEPVVPSLEPVKAEPGVVAASAREPVPMLACVAFAPTSSGYVLVPLDGAVPAVGEVVELEDLGKLHVLRHTPSPLPLDRRTCVILERRRAHVLTFSFA